MHANSSNLVLQEMYSSHQDWLQNWLRRRLASNDLAADLTQDTFVSLLTGRNVDLQNIQQPRAYLTTIAKCILANYYQRQTLEAAYQEALSHLPEAQSISTEERLILLQTLQEIDAMLDQLPIKVRQAFLLLHLEDCNYAQIALKINVSERTVKRYMATAFEHCLTLM